MATRGEVGEKEKERCRGKEKDGRGTEKIVVLGRFDGSFTLPLTVSLSQGRRETLREKLID